MRKTVLHEGKRAASPGSFQENSGQKGRLTRLSTASPGWNRVCGGLEGLPFTSVGLCGCGLFTEGEIRGGGETFCCGWVWLIVGIGWICAVL